MGCLLLISRNGFTSKGILKSIIISSATEKIFDKDREFSVSSSLETVCVLGGGDLKCSKMQSVVQRFPVPLR